MSESYETFIYPEGRVIIEQGEPAMEAFLIESGKVKVTMERDGKTVELAELGEDQIFGETALFKGSDYGATVTAAEETTVIKITPDILDAKIRLCDPMLRALIKMMMERQRRSNAALAEYQSK
ncbi:MAG TPA: Crp/Fnr family transcriptional regulator [Alphaproteobacteria bacterium]|nr:Crp/Fnr family transcriptional regulator [Alphaproteobacteria bacterium]